MPVACPGRSRRLRPGFEALDFLADLTQHIPPKGRWEQMPWVAERAPDGWKAAHERDPVAVDPGYEPLSDGDEEVDIDASKRAWVQRFAKRYRKPEGPGFSRRSTGLIRWCASGCMREQVAEGPTSGSAAGI